MPGSEKNLSLKLYDKIFDLNIMSHIIFALLMLVIGMINFGDFTNVKFSYDRLMESSFWVLFSTRYISYIVLRLLYGYYGSRKKKSSNPAHIETEAKIIESREKIELDNRLEEFKEYVEQEVDRDDLLELYEKLLSNQIANKSKKIFGMFTTKGRKQLVWDMVEEKKNIRLYRAALNSKDEERIEEAKSNIDIDKINIKGRVPITPDIIFDGVKYEKNDVISSLTFDESKEIGSNTVRGSVMSFITTMIITISLQGLTLSTDSWEEKLMNILVTFVMAVVTVVMAINSGYKISDKLLMSKNSRLRHLTVFLSRPRKIYEKEVKSSPQASIEVLEGINKGNDIN